jgi:cobalt-zinc-cadmium efflux system protein
VTFFKKISGSPSSLLLMAIILNLALAAVQVIFGWGSGSLALIADAIHNLTDVGTIVIAYVADKLSKRPADNKCTFGYKRAECLAIFANAVILIMLGINIIVESTERLFDDHYHVHGVTVVWISILAIVINFMSASLMYFSKRRNNNIRLICVHGYADGLRSVGMLISGILITEFGLNKIDVVFSIILAVFIITQAKKPLPRMIRILLEHTPKDIDVDEIKMRICAVENVKKVEHMHVWEISMDFYAFEAHIHVDNKTTMKKTKAEVRKLLTEEFKISHSTLEIEV